MASSAASHGSHSRKLLLLQQQQGPLPAPASAEPALRRSNSVEAGVIMILAVLLCALIAAVVASVVVRCALRVARWAWAWAEPPRAAAPPASVPCFRGCAAAAAAARVKSEAALTTASDLKPYSTSEAAGGEAECAICLSEFAHGEFVRVLPNCKHGFHAQCVDRWLASRLSCPTCRRCLFDGGVGSAD
ncbi:hypothetical protein Cni_G03335 [Canna indica]|uniref:RING-type domain-containing protein n=1 Tax=Canna indica TaxID=4628 RepID=A0AAQ3Q2Z1_9LILI|nr:hypothetical protein Cni_G03335 [Canna indica]